MVPIEIEGLNFLYGKRLVLKDVSFKIEGPGFYVVLGPNGSGKTTLLRTMAGILSPSSGVIKVYGKGISKMSQKEVAKLVSLVPQRFEFRYPFTVREVLAMGYYPYLSLFEFTYKPYMGKVGEVASLLGIENLLERPVTSLSGGQIQRVLIGKVLIQDTPIYLLDEPLSSLDIKYKLSILRYFKGISQEKVVISTFHELELVGFYADEIIFLKEGMIFAKGKTEKVLTEKSIKEVFDIEAKVEGKSGKLRINVDQEVFKR